MHIGEKQSPRFRLWENYCGFECVVYIGYIRVKTFGFLMKSCPFSSVKNVGVARVIDPGVLLYRGPYSSSFWTSICFQPNGVQTIFFETNLFNCWPLVVSQLRLIPFYP